MRIRLVVVAATLCLGFLCKAESLQSSKPGNYFSAQRSDFPPLPFTPFPDRPVFSIGNSNFIYDDRDIDYRQRQTMENASAEDNQILYNAFMDYGTNFHIWSAVPESSW